MHDVPSLPSDRELLVAARDGHDAAWHELMRRHEWSIRRVVPNRRRGDRRLVGDALDALRRELQQSPPEGEPAIRAFRPRAIAAVTGGSFGPEAGRPRIDRADDQRLLATAFVRLPEPWQTVLWHSHVEELTAAEVSPLVGRTVNGVTELLATAERGLVDAYLLEYCNEGDVDAEAQRVVGLLGGYARSALSPTDRRSVEAHLAVDPRDRDGERPAAGMRRHTSADSRRLLGVASSLPQLLPPAIAPGITGLSIEQHRAALGTSERALGSAARRADRSSRVRIAVVIGSLIAAVLAVIGVAYLVRQPSDGGHGAVPSVPMPSVPMPSVPVPSGAMPSGAMPSGAMPNGPGLHAGAYALGIDSPNATLALDASSSDVGLRSRVLGSTVGPDA